LRLFAKTASANMRTDDVIGRLGGEEFAAVVPGDGDVASGIAERVRMAFETAGVDVSGCPLKATVSIGAAWTAEAVRIDELLAAADAALYRAKEAGRNRLELATEPLRGIEPDRALATAPARAPRPPVAMATRRIVIEARRLQRAVVAAVGMPGRHPQLRPARLPASRHPANMP
jgi:hypothetical protein